MLSGQCVDDVWRDALHDLEVVAYQIITAHARFARLPRRDHDNVGTGSRTPVAAADDAGIGSENRARLVHVERDAGGFLIRDVDDDDVGQLFLRDGARHRRTDVSRASHNRHFSFHYDPLRRSATRRCVRKAGWDVRILRAMSRSSRAGYAQFLLKTLLKRGRRARESARDSEHFSGLHHRSASHDTRCVAHAHSDRRLYFLVIDDR